MITPGCGLGTYSSLNYSQSFMHLLCWESFNYRPHNSLIVMHKILPIILVILVTFFQVCESISKEITIPISLEYELLDALEHRLGVGDGETTADRKFDLNRVACLGCCALAPVIMIDDKVYGQMSVLKLRELIDEYEQA